jgi:hypothetical protein
MASLALARDFEDSHLPWTDERGQTAPEFTDEQTASLRTAHIDRLALRLMKGEPVSTFPLAEIAEARSRIIVGRRAKVQRSSYCRNAHTDLVAA